MLLTNGTHLGPYKILALIGEGGMGQVYRAIDNRLNRTVAIKILPHDKVADPERKRRFLQEARTASSLNHPNIVVLYDMSNDGGTDFLVMEYIAGHTLKELIPPHGMPFEGVMRIGAQAASALAAAHAAGIVHRDIKPANIMVTADQLVKVLDFGIAKMVLKGAASTDSVDTEELTIPGALMGTAAYMSPEQTRGEAVDGRSDIFSLGSVLYEAATGQLPFSGPSALSVMHAIATAVPLPPSIVRPGLPHGFDALIARCLAKDSSRRFARMEEVTAALRDASTGSSVKPVEVTTPMTAVAVLPFANVSGDPENEFFGDGLTEDLINGLSQIDALHVTSRSSAFVYRGKQLDVRAVGKTLNVTAVVEGSVRRSGNRLRVTAQLINVADGYNLWSERYDREITDVFDIQDEISRTIVEKLRPRLIGSVSPPVLRRHTEDPEAYSLYLKGRYYWEKRPAGTNRAIECFEKAIERDPEYALAHTGLADAYNTLASWEGGILPPQEGFRKGIAYAEQALRLDSRLAEAYAALGYALLHHRWNLREAERSFTQAISLNPRYGPAHHWYSHLLIADERLEESLSESLAYLKIDPVDQFSLVHMAWHYLMAHDFDKALAESRRALRDEPNFAWHHVFHGWALLNTGAHFEAEREMQHGLELAGGPNVMLTSLAHAQAISGQREKSLLAIDQLTKVPSTKYVSPYEIGLIYEALANTREAFQWWEKAYEERSPWLVYLPREHRLRHLHGQPEFESLVTRIRNDLRRGLSSDSQQVTSV